MCIVAQTQPAAGGLYAWFSERLALVAGQILRSVTKQILLRKLLDVDDPRRDKNSGLAGTVRRRHLNQRLFDVSAGTFEPQAAARIVFALDKFLAALRMTD